jgi:hypothetical protein
VPIIQRRQLLGVLDRHAKEGAEAVLFDGGDILEAGVFLRIGEVDGLRRFTWLTMTDAAIT